MGSPGARVRTGTEEGAPGIQGRGGTPWASGWTARAGTGLGDGGAGPHHVLVVEQVHDASRPLAHGHQVRRGLVEPQQTQGRALLHAVHAVPAGAGWGGLAQCDPSPQQLPSSLAPPRRAATERADPDPVWRFRRAHLSVALEDPWQSEMSSLALHLLSARWAPALRTEWRTQSLCSHQRHRRHQ